MDITIRSTTQQPLTEFLENHDYLVETLKDNILAVKNIGGPSIYIALENLDQAATLYFELSLGELGNLRQNAAVLYKLLDLNSEIAPVSVAINSQANQLCLVERLEGENLDSNEILSVLESMGLACLRVQQLFD